MNLPDHITDGAVEHTSDKWVARMGIAYAGVATLACIGALSFFGGGGFVATGIGTVAGTPIPAVSSAAPDAPTVTAVPVSDTSFYLLGSAYSGDGGTHSNSLFVLDTVGGAFATSDTLSLQAGPDSLVRTDTIYNSALNNIALATAGGAVLIGRAQYTDENGTSAFGATDTFTVSLADSVGIIFESNWDAATGVGTTAQGDGGIWGSQVGCGSYQDSIMVIDDSPPAGSPTANAARFEGRRQNGTGSDMCAIVREDDFRDNADDFYLRMWVYYDIDTNEFQMHHSVTLGYTLPFMVLMSPSYFHQSGFWRPSVNGFNPPNLSLGAWYRFELFYDAISSTTFNLYPRVYSAAGSLLYDESDFSDGSQTLEAANDGGTFTLPSVSQGNDIQVTQEGNGGIGNPDTPYRGQYLWYAGFAICEDWCGTFIPNVGGS